MQAPVARTIVMRMLSKRSELGPVVLSCPAGPGSRCWGRASYAGWRSSASDSHHQCSADGRLVSEQRAAMGAQP
jgi:hypothetical protein